MPTRVRLSLEEEEFSALMKLATAELRNPSDQARHIVRLELQRIGLLDIQNDLVYPEYENGHGTSREGN
jgi:hypothetical protein